VAGVLKRAGHQVVSFSNLPQAQQAYQAGGFDLVVCDGTLKHDGDGYEWAESLHAQGQKVIMLSGNKPNLVSHGYLKATSMTSQSTVCSSEKRSTAEFGPIAFGFTPLPRS